MNPDKLFDYLDGKLSAQERAALEEKLTTDPLLQRELAIAREIHNGMRGSREVVDVTLDPTAHGMPEGATLGRKVATAFAVLVALNVGIGLYFIFLGGKKDHTSALHSASRDSSAPPGMTTTDEAKVRQQLIKSLERTAGDSLSSTRIGTDEISITAPVGQREAVANKVIAAAMQCGGSGTKGLLEENALSVFVELSSGREADFRRAIAPLNANGASAGQSSLGPAIASSPGEKTRLQIRIFENALPVAK
jgi:hypothetical protein